MVTLGAIEPAMKKVVAGRVCSLQPEVNKISYSPRAKTHEIFITINLH